LASENPTQPNTVLNDVMKRNSKFEIRNPKSKGRGAAIMLALWALFLLAAMVISWVLDIDARFSLSANANRRLEATALACSGAEVALHPMVKPGSPNLRRQINDRRSYEARMTGEGGRLNLNGIVGLALVGQEARLDVLRRYLEKKEIDINERDTMIDSLLDWMSPGGGLHRLNAPPESDNYHPAHALFTRIDELKNVFGWADFTSKAGWDDDFTVNTNPNDPIDVTSASRAVLLALLPAMNENIVDRFLELRRGPDGIDGTSDDMQFKSLPEIQTALGLSQDQFRVLAPLIGFNSQVYRVVSIGKSGDAQRTVRLVFRKTGGAPQVITWKEY